MLNRSYRVFDCDRFGLQSVLNQNAGRIHSVHTNTETTYDYQNRVATSTRFAVVLELDGGDEEIQARLDAADKRYKDKKLELYNAVGKHNDLVKELNRQIKEQMERLQKFDKLVVKLAARDDGSLAEVLEALK